MVFAAHSCSSNRFRPHLNLPYMLATYPFIARFIQLSWHTSRRHCHRGSSFEEQVSLWLYICFTRGRVRCIIPQFPFQFCTRGDSLVRDTLLDRAFFSRFVPFIGVYPHPPNLAFYCIGDYISYTPYYWLGLSWWKQTFWIFGGKRKRY